MKLSIAEITRACSGTLVQGEKDLVAKALSTDTRKIKSGDLYLALQGPNFDGHDFVPEAIKKGAIGVVVSKPCSLPKEIAQICVDDTLKALGEIAHDWRMKFIVPVVALTGSCGKTSTKEMIAACLSPAGSVCKTEGNLNNLIGLPLSILSLTEDHHYAVWEMGMNHLGEISQLTQIAEPTVGLITNIGLAHLEGVKDLDGVARAKAELFEGLHAQATAVFNRDDPFISRMKTKAQKITYGFSKGADIFCERVEMMDESMILSMRDPDQKTDYKIPFIGQHHAENFLACVAVCYRLGVTPEQIQEGIRQCEPPSGRGEVIHLKEDILVIDDTYNANPASIQAALKAFVLKFKHRRKIVVLGEMYELGDQTERLHQEVGKKIAGAGIPFFIAYGSHAKDFISGYRQENPEGEGFDFMDMQKVNDQLEKLIREKDVILVKGSRGAKMEQVVEYLKRLT